MADFNSTDLKLYVSASAPATSDISTSYTEVGYIIDLNITRTREAIPTSSKTDGDNSSYTAGRRDWSVDVSCLFDKESDAGQLIFDTAWNATDSTVYFLITSNTSGDDEWWGSGLVTAYDNTLPDNAAAGMSATIQGTGSLSMQAATTTT